jgi:hypothetical protein
MAFLLKDIGKQRVPVLPQEHTQLGMADTFGNGVFCWRQLDGRMPQRWTQGKPSLRNG